MEIKYHINGGEGNFKKKRSRGRHVIGVVLYMFRRRQQKTKTFNEVWQRVVDSVRHLKTDKITIMPSLNITILPSVVDGGDDNDRGEELSETVEVFTATSSSYSSPEISGYGSAKSLREMDCLDEECDDNDYDDDDDDDDGDEMIDEKAEEFIERFYEQMRMQNQAYNTQRYKAKDMIMV